MFNVSLVKIALACLFAVETLPDVAEARTTRRNKRAYPAIAAAFENWGGDLYWLPFDVETQDGYELTAFRLIGRRRRKKIPNQWSKGPVLLLHGFAKDAYQWMDRSDTSSEVLPAKLFRLGYDPWIFSTRGTRYSITHSSLDARRSTAEQYWNYDFEDVANNDIEAMLKLIMNT